MDSGLGVREPDWQDVECKQSLKMVLKWEINSLLQRLADVGEETVVLTANVVEDSVSHLGSAKGQGFFYSSEFNFLKDQFLSYCKGCVLGTQQDFKFFPTTSLVTQSNVQSNENHGGTSKRKQLLSRPKTKHKRSLPGPSLNDALYKSAHLNKHNAVDRDQETVLLSSDSDVNPAVHVDVNPSSSSMNHGQELNEADRHEGQGADEHGCESVKTKDPVHNGNKVKASRRKHTPKKLVMSHCYSDEDTELINDRLISGVSDSEFIARTVKREPDDSEGALFHGSEDEVSYFNSTKEVSKNKHASRLKVKLKEPETTPSLDSLEEGGDGLSDQLPWLPSLGNQAPAVVQSDDYPLHMYSTNQVLTGLKDTMETKGSIRPSGGGFKAVHHDETPVETVVLDKSKRGVRKYQCPYCDLFVRDRHDLKRHLRTHTKEKPYSCDVCARKFSRKWDLLNHAKKHGEGGEMTLKDEHQGLGRVKTEEPDQSAYSLYLLSRTSEMGANIPPSKSIENSYDVPTEEDN